MITYDYLMNVLEYLGQTDALLLRYVLLVCDVIAIILSSSWSVSTQALLTPRLLRMPALKRSLQIMRCRCVLTGRMIKMWPRSSNMRLRLSVTPLHH